jgi:hypothetical protein
MPPRSRWPGALACSRANPLAGYPRPGVFYAQEAHGGLPPCDIVRRGAGFRSGSSLRRNRSPYSVGHGIDDVGLPHDAAGPRRQCRLERHGFARFYESRVDVLVFRHGCSRLVADGLGLVRRWRHRRHVADRNGRARRRRVTATRRSPCLDGAGGCAPIGSAPSSARHQCSWYRHCTDSSAAERRALKRAERPGPRSYRAAA